MIIDIFTRIILPLLLLVLVVKIINEKKNDIEIPLQLFLLFVPLAWFGYGVYITLFKLFG